MKLWIVWLLLPLGLGLGLLLARPDRPAPATGTPAPLTVEVAVPAASPFPTTIRAVPPTPRVATGGTDAQGRAVTVACSTCHQTTAPNPRLRSGAELTQFHQGLDYRHGSLTCLSCHDARNYDRLRLADGTELAFAETMALCAQCHGQKRRDYEHGAHGGMQGFWDLARGPRTRNSCVHCHDPHAPAQPQVRPVLPPRDRLSVPARD